MAGKLNNTAKCGSTTIDYPPDCAYYCSCTPGGGCSWVVECPNGSTYGGTGLTSPNPPKHPQVAIAGKLGLCAKILEKKWKRPVIVPKGLRHRMIRKRTFRGTREQIAEALGLQLGPSARGRRYG